MNKKVIIENILMIVKIIKNMIDKNKEIIKKMIEKKEVMIEKDLQKN